MRAELYFIAPKRYSKLTNFKSNKKIQNHKKQLLKPIKGFKNSYRRKKNSIWLNKGNNNKYKISNSERRKWQLRSLLYRKLKKPKKLINRLRITLYRLSSIRGGRIINYWLKRRLS
jgi:hypothetical protein